MTNDGGPTNPDDPWNLDDWVAYKKRKAHAFVERGYSVEWYPDAGGWMDFYLPQRKNRYELRASVKFFQQPSKYGIDGGRISKLSVMLRETDPIKRVPGESFYEATRVLYHYDRGLDFDDLAGQTRGRRLYDAVLDELN